MFVLNENQHPASALKPVLTGEIGANCGITGRRNAEVHLTACLAGHFLTIVSRIATPEIKFTAII